MSRPPVTGTDLKETLARLGISDSALSYRSGIPHSKIVRFLESGRPIPTRVAISLASAMAEIHHEGIGEPKPSESTCDWVAALASGRALDKLTFDELRALNEHRRDCRVCRMLGTGVAESSYPLDGFLPLRRGRLEWLRDHLPLAVFAAFAVLGMYLEAGGLAWARLGGALLGIGAFFLVIRIERLLR